MRSWKEQVMQSGILTTGMLIPAGGPGLAGRHYLGCRGFSVGTGSANIGAYAVWYQYGVDPAQ